MADTAHVAVTGAGGYLGQHVVAVLKGRRGVTLHTTTTQEVDLLDQYSTDEWINTLPTGTTLIHCAASVPKTLEEYHDAGAAMDSMLMVENLLEAAIAGPLARLVFVSSLTACREDTRYAQGKCFAEHMVEQALAPDARLILRLPGLFGHPRTSGHVYDTIKREGECPPPSWPVMWVRDAAEYVVRAALLRRVEERWCRYHIAYTNPTLLRVLGDLGEGVTLEQRLDDYATRLAQGEDA